MSEMFFIRISNGGHARVILGMLLLTLAFEP